MSEDNKKPNGFGILFAILLILFGILMVLGGSSASFDGINKIYNSDSSSKTKVVESADNPLFKVEFKLVPLED